MEIGDILTIIIYLTVLSAFVFLLPLSYIFIKKIYKYCNKIISSYDDIFKNNK